MSNPGHLAQNNHSWSGRRTGVSGVKGSWGTAGHRQTDTQTHAHTTQAFADSIKQGSYAGTPPVPLDNHSSALSFARGSCVSLAPHQQHMQAVGEGQQESQHARRLPKSPNCPPKPLAQKQGRDCQTSGFNQVGKKAWAIRPQANRPALTASQQHRVCQQAVAGATTGAALGQTLQLRSIPQLLRHSSFLWCSCATSSRKNMCRPTNAYDCGMILPACGDTGVDVGSM
jgi:hypothetical protein